MALDFEQAYFEGHLGLGHASGYTDYRRMSYNAKLLDRVGTEAESTGNNIGDIMKQMNVMINSRFVGKSCLVLGSAYGYEVYQLRQLGIDAHGLDVSQWAYDQADASLKPDHLTIGDVLDILPTYKRNEWDYIFSRDFLGCFTDGELATLISSMNRVCKNDQLHVIYQNNPTWYNVKSLTEWQAMPFKSQTILVQADDFPNYVTVIN